jgi:hypothetical protein
MHLEEPLIVGIVFYFCYMTFELFVRKKERLILIEKLGQNIMPADPETLKVQFSSLLPSFKNKSFTALRIGLLLIGIGLGLLVGLFINLSAIGVNYDNNWQVTSMMGVSYTASVLLFGGLGLLISFLIENHLSKKKEE